MSGTRCAVTLRAFDEDEGREFIMQIVLRTAADPADIVTNFDLPPPTMDDRGDAAARRERVGFLGAALLTPHVTARLLIYFFCNFQLKVSEYIFETFRNFQSHVWNFSRGADCAL